MLFPYFQPKINLTQQINSCSSLLREMIPLARRLSTMGRMVFRVNFVLNLISSSVLAPSSMASRQSHSRNACPASLGEMIELIRGFRPLDVRSRAARMVSVLSPGRQSPRVAPTLAMTTEVGVGWPIISARNIAASSAAIIGNGLDF